MADQLYQKSALENLTLSEIKQHLENTTPNSTTIAQLMADPRKGTTRIAEELKRNKKRQELAVNSVKNKKEIEESE